MNVDMPRAGTPRDFERTPAVERAAVDSFRGRSPGRNDGFRRCARDFVADGSQLHSGRNSTAARQACVRFRNPTASIRVKSPMDQPPAPTRRIASRRGRFGTRARRDERHSCSGCCRRGGGTCPPGDAGRNVSQPFRDRSNGRTSLSRYAAKRTRSFRCGSRRLKLRRPRFEAWNWNRWYIVNPFHNGFYRMPAHSCTHQAMMAVADDERLAVAVEARTKDERPRAEIQPIEKSRLRQIRAVQHG